jgi:hypothetical protein
MDGPGEPAHPRGIDPPAAFFGLWPKFVESPAAERSRVLPPLRWRTVPTPETPRLRIA